MKSAVFTLLALTTVLLLAGCGPTTNTDSDPSEPFIGGTEGLGMSFMEGAPPRVIYDSGQLPFGISILLENKGESDVGPDAENSNNREATIEIIGINPAQLGYAPMEKSFAQERITLTGARRIGDGSIIAGANNVMSFDGFSYLPDEVGNTKRTIRANICYDYSTRSNTVICIKDNVLENVEDNTICTLAGVKDPKNSGAPVHVTTLTEAPAGKNKIFVTFTVENVGTGQVFARVPVKPYQGNSNNYCDTSPTNPNRNWVHIKVSLGDDYSTGYIQCPQMGNDNEGDIQLFQGSPATVTCTIETNPKQGAVYTDSLRVQLEYKYYDFIETPVMIRDYSAG